MAKTAIFANFEKLIKVWCSLHIWPLWSQISQFRSISHHFRDNFLDQIMGICKYYDPCHPRFFRQFRSISKRYHNKNFFKKNDKIANFANFAKFGKMIKFSKYGAFTYIINLVIPTFCPFRCISYWFWEKNFL